MWAGHKTTLHSDTHTHTHTLMEQFRTSPLALDKTVYQVEETILNLTVHHNKLIKK